MKIYWKAVRAVALVAVGTLIYTVAQAVAGGTK